jgi:hypothetical protein
MQAYQAAYFLDGKRDYVSSYETLITVDPGWFNMIDQSFTFLHWSIIEQLQKGELDIENLDDNVIEKLLYTVLPGGNTIIHKLCDQEETLMKLFKIANPRKDDEIEIKYHVPFLPNLDGKSPLHICKEKEDYKSLGAILKYLQHYPIDHHSRAIKDLMPLFIEKQLPELLDYLDTRMLQTQTLTTINKGCLGEDSIGIEASPLCFNKEDLYKNLLKPSPIENRVKFEFVDMPGIYHYEDKTFQDFFEQLS